MRILRHLGKHVQIDITETELETLAHSARVTAVGHPEDRELAEMTEILQKEVDLTAQVRELKVRLPNKKTPGRQV